MTRRSVLLVLLCSLLICVLVPCSVHSSLTSSWDSGHGTPSNNLLLPDDWTYQLASTIFANIDTWRGWSQGLNTSFLSSPVPGPTCLYVLSSASALMTLSYLDGTSNTITQPLTVTHNNCTATPDAVTQMTVDASSQVYIPMSCPNEAWSDILSVDGNTGRVLWHISAPDCAMPVVVQDQQLLFICQSGVYLYSSLSGSLISQFEVSLGPVTSDVYYYSKFNLAYAIVNQTVLAFDVPPTQIVWNVPLPNDAGSVCQLSIDASNLNLISVCGYDSSVSSPPSNGLIGIVWAKGGQVFTQVVPNNYFIVTVGYPPVVTPDTGSNSSSAVANVIVGAGGNSNMIWYQEYLFQGQLGPTLTPSIQSVQSAAPPLIIADQLGRVWYGQVSGDGSGDYYYLYQCFDRTSGDLLNTITLGNVNAVGWAQVMIHIKDQQGNFHLLGFWWENTSEVSSNFGAYLLQYN